MAIEQGQSAVRSGAIALILLILAAVATWLLAWPQYREYQQSKTNLAIAELERDKRVNTIHDIDSLINSYNSQMARLSVMDEALPGSPNVPQLLADLETIALSTGMQMQELEIDQSTNQEQLTSAAQEQLASTGALSGPSIEQVRLHLSVKGSHVSFPQFLAAMEDNLRLFDIKIINAGEESEEGVTFDMAVSAYYQAQGEKP